MTFSGKCWRRRLVVLAIATSLLGGCGTAGSDRPTAVACPPVVGYGAELQARAAAEVEALPEGSAVADAAQRLRGDARPGAGLRGPLSTPTDLNRPPDAKGLARGGRTRTYHEHARSQRGDMDRRSPPQKRTDDHAFPVRVKVLVPERGFENLLLDMHRWLDAEVGRGSYAVHGAGAGLTHATAWYFRTVEEAQAFVTKFPMLELADGTELPTYQSPHLPFGRGAEWSDPVCNLVLDAEVAGGDAPALRRADRPRRQHAAAARHLSRTTARRSSATDAEGRELVMARWGMPTPPQYLAGKKVDRGVTNIRQTTSSHWRAVARTRASLPRALHQLRRERDRSPTARGRRSGSPSTRAGRSPSSPASGRPGPRCGRSRRGRSRADLFGFLTSAPNAEVGGGPSQGDAGDPDRAGRVGDLARRALGGGEGAAAAAAGRLAAHCAPGREGGFRRDVARYAGEWMTPASTPLSLDLPPMEAEAVDELPSGPGWQYEPKYDGFRCLAHRRGDRVHLQSKNQKPLERYFPEVAARARGDRRRRTSCSMASSSSPVAPSRACSCACIRPRAASASWRWRRRRS